LYIGNGRVGNNKIGDAGAKAIARALEKNTTITILYLGK
jgi:hypothetical protein